jgi:MscS family membrane protein
MSESVEVFFGKVAFILLVINITWIVRNLVNAFVLNYFEKIAAKTESDLDDQLLPIVKILINFIIFAIAIIYIVDNMGYDIASLVAGLGIGGLAFALAAQDTLKNLFGGFTVFADKPFKVGDRVKIDEQRDGFIREIGVRSTKMETFDGTKIVVPNSVLVNSIVENVSAEKARRVKIMLGLEYNTSSAKLEKACDILKDIVKKNKNTEDRVFVVFKEFADSSLNIQLTYYISNLDRILDTQHEINMEIKKRFDKEKLSFAYPSRTVYMKKSK